MNKPYWLLVCQLNVCIFWCLLWWVGQCRLPSCMAGCLGGLPAAWEVPQPWLSSHLQGANSKPWVELWALSRTQKMRFRQVTAHWYSAWSRKCRVWQCRTMYDMWIQAPPWTHHIVEVLWEGNKRCRAGCSRGSRGREALCGSQGDVGRQPRMFSCSDPSIYIYRWYFDISNGMVICQNIPSI